ncbi:MAG TPA: hypothetical protein VIN36_10405 [Thiobacillus sp.]
MNQRQKALQALLTASALLYRDITPQERREAARALGLEHMLPDGEQEQIEFRESKDA